MTENKHNSLKPVPLYTRLIDLIHDLKSDSTLITEIEKEHDLSSVWFEFAHNQNILDIDIVQDLSRSTPIYNKVIYTSNQNLQWTTVLQFCRPEEQYGITKEDDNYWFWDSMNRFSIYFKYHPELPWHLKTPDWDMGLDFVVDIHTALQYRYDWNWQLIAEHTPVNIVYTYKLHPIFKYIGYCPDITVQWIKAHPDCGINLYVNRAQKLNISNVNNYQIINRLSLRTDIDDVIANPDVQWDYNSLCRNPTLTAEYVIAHFDEILQLVLAIFYIMSNPNVQLSVLLQSRRGIEFIKLCRKRMNSNPDMLQVRTLKELLKIIFCIIAQKIIFISKCLKYFPNSREKDSEPFV
jgi:hypothetical protein